MNAAHFRKLENMYLGAPISRLYQPTIRISEGLAEIAIPVAPAFFHAAGALHGSVYFKVLDDACFFAVASLVEACSS
jgi:acyl-coenzyme A thioesterase PaaI-like protein